MNERLRETIIVEKIIQQIRKKFRSKVGHDLTNEQIEARLIFLEQLCEEQGVSPLYIREVMEI